MKRTTTSRGFVDPDPGCMLAGFLLTCTIVVAFPLMRVARDAGAPWWHVLLIFPMTFSAVSVYFIVIPYMIAKPGELVARLLKHRDSGSVYYTLLAVTWIVLLLVGVVCVIIALIAVRSET